MKTRLALASAAAAAVLLLGSCGSSEDAEPKPSVEQVSRAMQDMNLPADVSDCIAERLHGDLPAKALNALVDGDEDATGSADEVAEATKAAKEAATACAAEVGASGAPGN